MAPKRHKTVYRLNGQNCPANHLETIWAFPNHHLLKHLKMHENLYDSCYSCQWRGNPLNSHLQISLSLIQHRGTSGRPRIAELLAARRVFPLAKVKIYFVFNPLRTEAKNCYFWWEVISNNFLGKMNYYDRARSMTDLSGSIAGKSQFNPFRISIKYRLWSF